MTHINRWNTLEVLLQSICIMNMQKYYSLWFQAEPRCLNTMLLLVPLQKPSHVNTHTVCLETDTTRRATLQYMPAQMLWSMACNIVIWAVHYGYFNSPVSEAAINIICVRTFMRNCKKNKAPSKTEATKNVLLIYCTPCMYFCLSRVALHKGSKFSRRKITKWNKPHCKQVAWHTHSTRGSRLLQKF